MLVLAVVGHFVGRYPEYRGGPYEFLVLDFECHSEFGAV
jgi:hypothetical protein